MKSLMDYGELMSLEDLAEYFGFSSHTIYSWNRRGTGPKRVKIGNKVFYPKTDVIAWINAQEVQA